MDLTQVSIVARREYLSRVRNKAFIISTLAVPVLFAVLFFVVAMAGWTDVDELRLTVVDAGTGFGDGFADKLRAMERPEIRIEGVVEVDDVDDGPTRRSLSERVRDGEIDGYLVLRPDDTIGARLQYFARETSNPTLGERLESVYEATVLERWLAGSGVDPDQIDRLQAAGVEMVTVSEEGEEAGGYATAAMSSLLLGLLLMMTVMTQGQQMAMAIAEEKSSRLIELILGAVTATEFMAGKIAGVFAAGLTQLGIWAAMGAVAFLYALPGLMVGGELGGLDLGALLSTEVIVYFPIFFLLGYLLYATLLAAIASTCTTSQEVTTAMQPAIYPMLIAFYFMFYASANPNSLLTRIVSFIPPFTPLVMFARVNVGSVPTWEVWAGITVLALGAAATVWVSAKIFRVTLLIHGKRPGPGELWRLVKAA